MALSGSQDFTVTRDELIKMSLQHIGRLGEGESPNATQVTEASLYLNMLVKFWQADDIQLWVRKIGYILPVSDVAKTSLGAEGGHATNSYAYTTLTSDEVLGASTITVSSVTGIATGYYIGVELSDGTMQWTTVNGAPAGLVVTLTNVLTGAAASGGAIYCYQTKISRPVRVLDSYIRLSSANTDTPLEKKTQQEYNALPNKLSEGIATAWYYEETLGLSTTLHPGNGDFFYWPIFQNGKNVIVLEYTKIFDDLDSSSNNVEFPQMWFLPLMVGLAWLLSAKNALSLQERKLLQQEAEFLKKQVKDFDQEFGSIYLTPNKG